MILIPRRHTGSRSDFKHRTMYGIICTTYENPELVVRSTMAKESDIKIPVVNFVSTLPTDGLKGTL